MLLIWRVGWERPSGLGDAAWCGGRTAMQRLIAPTTFVVLALLAGSATAQQPGHMPCHNATEIAKQLSNKYAEAPVAFGLQSNGNLLQVYASEETGTWTVVTISPTGMACIVAAGKRWEQMPPDISAAVTPDGETVYFRCSGAPV
ncbi:MAG: hypothetical protein ACREF4_02495 [Gammaproteobacteria bacterium]